MFSPKVAIVTGGASGIGKALCKRLGREGIIPVAIDKNEESLKKASLEVRKFGIEFDSFACDLTNEKEFAEVFETICKKYGRIEYFFNNAGVSGHGDAAKMPMEKYASVMKINTMATIQGTLMALNHMELKGSGTIVNMASVAGHVPAPYMTPYCASKYAVVGFTRSLRAELDLRSAPIRLLLVSPGFVDTEIISKGAQEGFPEWLDWMLSDTMSVADEIWSGILESKLEITPTISAKLMMNSYRLIPGKTVASAKILLTKSFKDFVLNRFTPPH